MSVNNCLIIKFLLSVFVEVVSSKSETEVVGLLMSGTCLLYIILLNRFSSASSALVNDIVVCY